MVRAKFGPGRLGLAWRGDAWNAELLGNARCGQERLGSWTGNAKQVLARIGEERGEAMPGKPRNGLARDATLKTHTILRY